MKKTDILVIGSGIAGLYFALKLATKFKITIITKDKPLEGSTRYAQGGIAAVTSPYDNIEQHIKDTLVAGAGLCDEQAVRIMVENGYTGIKDLVEMGHQFTRDKKGNLHLGREGGHSENRVVHTYDYTGKSLADFLWLKVKDSPNIEVLENHMAVDLVSNHQLKSMPAKTCYGAFIYSPSTGKVEFFQAAKTVLATGGAGQLYPFTTNPQVSTGDGIAIAYRAGCKVRNMEFFQFHPTAFYSKSNPAFLMTEALRGHGAYLINRLENRFMSEYDDRLELAPRDVVARAIDTELKKHGDDYVYLDLRHLAKTELLQNFPSIAHTLKTNYNLDINQDLIPVVPAAHYCCGGIMVDLNGKTDLRNCYALGETASTGVHGGNRLASNSLLEAIVFANMAAQDINQSDPEKQDIPKITWDESSTSTIRERVIIKHYFESIQKTMWDFVGIARSNARLQMALDKIDLVYQEVLTVYKKSILNRELLELRNLALCAQLIIRSARQRKESRGLHYNVDFPENTLPSREDTILRRDG